MVLKRCCLLSVTNSSDSLACFFTFHLSCVDILPFLDARIKVSVPKYHSNGFLQRTLDVLFIGTQTLAPLPWPSFPRFKQPQSQP